LRKEVQNSVETEIRDNLSKAQAISLIKAKEF